MFKVLQIDCENCNFCMYSEYLNDYDETVSFSYGGEVFCFDDYLYCNKCVRKCLNDECDNYVSKKDNKFINDYCEDCEKCFLIKQTCNDITSKLPVELVNMIFSYCL
jgi:hypothetical protein